jgi:hypothetical protein
MSLAKRTVGYDRSGVGCTAGLSRIALSMGRTYFDDEQLPQAIFSKPLLLRRQ